MSTRNRIDAALHRLHIRQRILLIFLAIALTGGVVQLAIAGRQLQLATLEFYQHHLETDALMMASTLSEPLEHYLDGEGDGTINRTLSAFQEGVGHDYMIVDGSYQVIGYTGGADFSQTARLPRTPELAQAHGERVGSDIRPDTSGANRLFVAVSLTYERQTQGYLIVSEPMQPAYTQIAQSWLELAVSSLPVIILVIAASLWVSGTISRPILELRNSALQMAGGALDTRIEVRSQDEVGQLAQTFNFMAEQVEALMKTQRSFVSNAAHELRTPLMTVKLRVDALLDESLDSDQKRTYLREAQQELEHMAELVSSLLVLARIDEGRHGRDGTITDPVATLHDIARHWRIEMKQAGLTFEAHIAPDLPNLPLSANDLRLILDNVLGNAVKYTSEGAVVLEVTLRDAHLLIEISDTGMGFTPEQSAHLFDRFYRAETTRAQYPGTGLGLSIAQSILEQYGGHIEATSQGVGHGATFLMRVPLNVTGAPVTPPL